ncbi:MAG: hypothetical protein ISS31_06065 [Kiritimatiellae bacterium]|nr:hypothetical protein [Kiritimatiellia bacterium]
MAGYFKRETPASRSLGGWLVSDRWHSSSAAKFWTGVLDELAAGYSEADHIEMEACIPGPLTRDLLDPRASLQRMVDSHQGEDLSVEIRKAAQELDLLGPPGSVTYRIADSEGAHIEAAVIPHVDAEVFAHLVVWLPEWAGIDSDEWNERDVTASFTVRRPERGQNQVISFALNHAPLHEGLYRCKLGHLRQELAET